MTQSSSYSNEDFLFATLKEFLRCSRLDSSTSFYLENVGNDAWMTFTVSLPNYQDKQEEAFLLNTVIEFYKRWSSGKDSRLKLDHHGTQTRINFSAVLKTSEKLTTAKKRKSPRKEKKDNERAAAFNSRKLSAGR